jgi:hypothetical protein
LRTFLKFIVGIPLGLYGVYVLAIALVLNTPIFPKLAQMTDPSTTHIDFVGAWSFVPGTIHFQTIKVLIREPDIELDVLLHHSLVKLDFKALLHKRARITLLNVGETTVDIRTKNAPAVHEQIGSVADYTRAKLTEEASRLAERWTIDIEKVELPNIPYVKLADKVLRGKMAIFGSFILQPGTQCEIYPSRFTIENGNWNDEITQIHLNSEVRFHRFMKARVSGSEVLRYVDAHLEGTAKTKGLGFVNITLRSLGDYGFGDDAAELAAKIDIRAGKIREGSSFQTEHSRIHLSGPRFDVTGNGGIAWLATGYDSSTLHASIDRANTDVRVGSNRITGTVRQVFADANLVGLDLTSAFSGLSGRLRVIDCRLESSPVRTTETDGLAYRFKAAVNGELSAIAGDFADDEGLPKPSRFTVDIDDSSVTVPKLGTVTGGGQVAIAVRPVDFRAGRVDLPQVQFGYRGQIDGKYPLVVGWKSLRASRIFGTEKMPDEGWQGSGKLKIADFDGILKYLSDTNRISGLVKVGLHATDIRSLIDWKIAPTETKLTVRDVDSNGIWSGSGTLTSEKSASGGPTQTTGDFHAKVLGIPINIKTSSAANATKTASE